MIRYAALQEFCTLLVVYSKKIRLFGECIILVDTSYNVDNMSHIWFCLLNSISFFVESLLVLSTLMISCFIHFEFAADFHFHSLVYLYHGYQNCC